ncbi:ABC transporter permease [Haloarchaeobius iranensis]|uniref:ABC-2 type transport system permease protein n=1 Tax=Haloarchaeobius iranensis TaxID=996166 RepID=A0A1G9UNF7_9EURY|nr:ABC transporter permease subunit [Haloarchaeobius iranensis]SDM61429.1 ABC-2 type transport system permease protein [Haloarchaeobius iranensis]
MSGETDDLFAVVERELTIVARTPAYIATAVGFAAVVWWLAYASSLTGYVPLVADLLTPVEVLVPLLAVAFGYRAIQADAASKELDVLRTYPLRPRTYVVGVFVGRATAVLSLVFVTLLVAGLFVPLFGPPANPVIATHGGDGPFGTYLRFVLLATCYAAVVLAAVVAVSTVAARGRTVIAAAVGVFVLLTVGLDLGLVAALSSGVVDPDALRYLLALSPNSAFRGLTLALSIRTVEAATLPVSAVLANVVGLALWLVGSLVLAALSVWSDPPTERWQVVETLSAGRGTDASTDAAADQREPAAASVEQSVDGSDERSGGAGAPDGSPED